jgi:ABC-2 type transport system ATP-binding protein
MVARVWKWCNPSLPLLMLAVELVEVTKAFGTKVAVDRLTLRVPAGSFLGLLGRNGAGKSTTLKLLTGLMAPTSGTIRLLGIDMDNDPIAIKRQIGTMPEDMGLLDQLTGDQYLRFVGRMRGLDEKTIEHRGHELFERLDLYPGPAQIIADYSFGMKKKISLVTALLHAPKVLFLDEPFEGIDPVTSRTIKDILVGLQQRGMTLVLTTHILEVVERLCPLIAILDAGQLKCFATLEELKARGGDRTLEAVFVDLVGGGKGGDLSWL